MEILFVGTGSGKTSLSRFHSSLIIKQNNFSLLVDAGDGISKALLNLNIDINKIDAVLFSHYHADHFAGIASLLTQMKLLNRSTKFTLFTQRQLKKQLISFINNSYLFSETIGFELEISGFDFENKIEITNNLQFTSKQNNHINAEKYPPEYEDVKFISSSFLFSAGERKIVYTADVRDENDLYLFSENDIFITETTHVSTGEIEKLFKTLQPKKLILTHIGDEDEEKILKWHSSLEPETKNRVIIAYDGMKIE